MRFRLRFLIIFLSLIIIPCYFLSSILIKKSESSVLNNYVNRTQIIADIEKARIIENINMNVERLKGSTSRTQLRRTLKSYLETQTLEDKDLMVKILSDVRNSIPDFEQIFIFDIHGDLICSTDGNVPEDFDLKSMVEQGLKKNFFTVEQDLLKQNKILMAGPLILDSESLGVLVIISKPNSIAEITSNVVNMGKTGEILIAKRTEKGDAQFISPLRFKNDPHAKKIVSHLLEDVPITLALNKNERSFDSAVDYRGQEVIAATRYIEPVDWGLVVKFDKAEVLSAMNDIKKVFWGIAAIIFVFILMIASILAFSIARPIEHMAEVANKIKAGHLDVKINSFVLSLDDEMGELARVLDGMTTQLINSNINLEVQVKERTKELEEARLKAVEAEERFRMIVEGVKDYAIFLLDVDGTIVTWNLGAERFKGYKANEIIGQHFSKFYGKEDIESGKPARELKIAQEEGIYIEEGIRIRKDGSQFWAHVLITALKDYNGNLRGFSKITRDISQEKKNEQDLRNTFQELERFNQVAVGREERMIELKEQINKLSEELDRKPPYDLSFGNTGGDRNI